MRLTALLLASLLSFLPAVVFATAQVPDTLVLEGKKESIFTNPLEPFFERNPKLRPEPSNTANWRGYVATFEVRDGGLWLQRVDVTRYVGKVKGEHTHETTNRLSDFFPGKKSVLVDWYTGALVIPRGKLVNYVHMGYGSTYERYLLLEIRDGKLVGRREMTAKQFLAHRRAMFERFKKTPAYARMVAGSEGKLGDKQTEAFLFEYAAADYLVPAGDP